MGSGSVGHLSARRQQRQALAARGVQPDLFLPKTEAEAIVAGDRLDRPAGAEPIRLSILGDVFWVLMLLSLAAVPLAMSLRKVKLGVRRPRAH